MKKICSIDGCNNTNILAKGMCNKHYKQIYRHGKTIRTIYDLNKIILHKDYAEIILYDRQGKEKATTLIDLEDLYRVKKYKWCCNSYGYVLCRETKEFLHRFIMNCPEDKVVDHINHNTFDNRKSNLRICTHQENLRNQSINSKNTSGTTGVSFRKDKNKWRAYITVNEKQISLGNFINKEDAIKARKEAEIRYFGEYRNK